MATNCHWIPRRRDRIFQPSTPTGIPEASLKLKNAWIALLLALVGVGLSVAAVGNFLMTMSRNRLQWTEDSTFRDHYLAVGSYYVQGFVVGFVLCFCLAIAAVALSSWIQNRRAARAATLHPSRSAQPAES
jgi:uncharacterized membrane protein YidH (DUF202 family)